MEKQLTIESRCGIICRLSRKKARQCTLISKQKVRKAKQQKRIFTKKSILNNQSENVLSENKLS